MIIVMGNKGLLVDLECEVPVPVVVVGVQDVLGRIVQDGLNISHGVTVIKDRGGKFLAFLE